MDNDTKHVLTILGFVACFGAGYFVYGAENKDTVKTGERFSVFSQIENILDGKKKVDFEDEKEAVQNAVNGYYQTDDKYFEYFANFESDTDSEDVDDDDYISSYSVTDNIVYIRSDSFLMNGIQGFTHFFRDNPAPETDGYIIDLRNNMGGYTDYCLSILGNFLDQPLTVGEYHYYNGNSKDLNVSGYKNTNGEKVVILVNENTMSAAEIFTASMKQFYNDITVVGTKTYGKGTFQEYEYLPDDEQFKYTAGYYTIGDWQCYDGVGIAPDIEVAMDYNPDIICTDDDIQLQTAFDLFK